MKNTNVKNKVKILIKTYRHFLAPIIVIKVNKKSREKTSEAGNA